MMSSHWRALSFMSIPQALQRRQQLFRDRQAGGHMNGGRKHIVGGLPHVHVVVGMNRLALVETVAAGQLDGPIADDLVGVHVRGCAGTGLVDVHGELIVELAGRNLAGRLYDRLGDCRLELAEIAVGDGGSRLDQAQRPDQSLRQRLAGDGKIFDGTLGLSTVVSLGGNLDVAHGVFFDAEVSHGQFPVLPSAQAYPKTGTGTSKTRSQSPFWDRLQNSGDRLRASRLSKRAT